VSQLQPSSEGAVDSQTHAACSSFLLLSYVYFMNTESVSKKKLLTPLKLELLANHSIYNPIKPFQNLNFAFQK
jgi:hypothetical protein